jgi:hypothetical protein
VVCRAAKKRRDYCADLAELAAVAKDLGRRPDFLIVLRNSRCWSLSSTELALPSKLSAGTSGSD